MRGERHARIRDHVAWLRSKGWFDVASIYGALAAEPIETLRLAWWSAKRPVGIDPLELIDSDLDPILFVHGKWSSRGQFGPLVEAMRPTSRPFFSVSLQGRGRFKERDFDAFWKRVEEIRSLYPRERQESLSIDVVGYSRGAEVVSQAAFEEVPIDGAKVLRNREGIGRVVLVGSPLSGRLPEGTELPASLLEVDGEWDVLVKGRSVLEGEQRYLVRRCGHSGLFLAQESLDRITSWVEPTDSG